MTISIEQFVNVEIRNGIIISAVSNIKARIPAYVLTIDFGTTIGIKTSSAQLTQNYSPESLIGKHILAVMNFAPRNIAGIVSEVLVLATVDESSGTLLIGSDERATLGSLIK